MKKYKTYIATYIALFCLITVTNAYLVFGNYDGINIMRGGALSILWGVMVPSALVGYHI